MVLLPGCVCCQEVCAGFPKDDTYPTYIEVDVVFTAASATVQARRTGEPGFAESSVSSTLTIPAWGGTYQLSRQGSLGLYRYVVNGFVAEVKRENVTISGVLQRRVGLQVQPSVTWSVVDPRTIGNSTPRVNHAFNSASTQTLCNQAANTVSYSCSFVGAVDSVGSSYSPGVELFGTTRVVATESTSGAGSACFVPLSLRTDYEVVFFTFKGGETLITDSSTFSSQVYTPNWTATSNAYRFRLSHSWSVQAVRLFYGSEVVPWFAG